METIESPAKKELEICTLSTAPFMIRNTQEKPNVHAITLYESNKALKINDL